jgi:hypothetical protein
MEDDGGLKRGQKIETRPLSLPFCQHPASTPRITLFSASHPSPPALRSWLYDLPLDGVSFKVLPYQKVAVPCCRRVRTRAWSFGFLPGGRKLTPSLPCYAVEMERAREELLGITQKHNDVVLNNVAHRQKIKELENDVYDLKDEVIQLSQRNVKLLAENQRLRKGLLGRGPGTALGLRNENTEVGSFSLPCASLSQLPDGS